MDAPEAVMVPEEPEQIATDVTVSVGLGLMVMVCDTGVLVPDALAAVWVMV